MHELVSTVVAEFDHGIAPFDHYLPVGVHAYGPNNVDERVDVSAEAVKHCLFDYYCDDLSKYQADLLASLHQLRHYLRLLDDRRLHDIRETLYSLQVLRVQPLYQDWHQIWDA